MLMFAQQNRHSPVAKKNCTCPQTANVHEIPITPYCLQLSDAEKSYYCAVDTCIINNSPTIKSDDYDQHYANAPHSSNAWLVDVNNSTTLNNE